MRREGGGRDTISIMSQNKAGKDTDKARFASFKMSGEFERDSCCAVFETFLERASALIPKFCIIFRDKPCLLNLGSIQWHPHDSYYMCTYFFRRSLEKKPSVRVWTG